MTQPSWSSLTISEAISVVILTTFDDSSGSEALPRSYTRPCSSVERRLGRSGRDPSA